MIRIATTGLVLAASLLLAACAASPFRPGTSRDGKAVENTEIHRGAQTNQKSSPDSGQSPAGDGLGGRGSGR